MAQWFVPPIVRTGRIARSSPVGGAPAAHFGGLEQRNHETFASGMNAYQDKSHDHANEP
jgi:hypothetical protein